MATDDAVSTEGGNFQIFEQFLNHSSANVFLDTPVDKIVRSTAPDNSQYWTVRSKRGQHAYKSIILAAPIHQTGIKFSFAHNVPPQPYVHLHVTLLTTTLPTPSPEYFKQKSDIPPMMLTTYEGVRSGGAEPEFNSLSYHGLVKGGPNEEGRPKEWTVKIFSKKKVSDAWLKKIFPGSVTWVHRKAWEAYPQLRVSQKYPSFKLHEGLYYVNALEPFISTMETETLASRNVVDLMLNAQYGTSICGPNGGSGNTTASFVYGWDC
jgi:prenylcysteine oxidase/farnesylcysteine lyase